MEKEKEKPTPGAEEDKDKKPAPAPETSFKKELDEIKSVYEEKITKLKEEFQKQIDERTQVIKELISGNPEAEKVANNSKSIAEQINETRKFEF